MKRIFIRTKYEEPDCPDKIQEYVHDEDGYYELVNYAYIGSYFNKLGETDDIQIIDHDDLGSLSLKNQTRVKLLIALQETNCGHCSTFINDKTFNKICLIYEDYLDELTGEMLKHAIKN